MPGLVPGIHDFLGKDVDGGDKPGHGQIKALHTFQEQ
jgi:hypothetical protein